MLLNRSIHEACARRLRTARPSRGISCTFCFCGMTRRIIHGIEVSDDTLMLDLIDQVGPGGKFMPLDVTAKRSRTKRSGTRR